MNIVKGVADFIKKSSGGHHSESSVRSQVDRFTLPACKFCFSVDGEESVLTNLWHNYEKATDKGEKKRMLGVFLKQFIEVYKTWEPPVSEEALDDTTSSTGEHSTVVGCSVGHPLEILVALIEEVKYLTSEVIGLNTSTMWTTDLSTVSTSVTISTEGLPLLEALMIIVRSVHNCRVFGYYGGLQKLIALLKAAVVQLKTIAGALSGDEALLDFAIKTFGFLQKLLVHVVSTICIFTDLNSNACKRAQWYTHSSIPIEKDENSTTDSCQCFRVSLSKMQRWKQKVTMSVMEAGGLNWLVELLRVIKSLTMQEPWTNMSLQYLTMRALHSVLSENTCAQNHFRSVGGLEVLLDELGLLSNNVLASQSSTCIPMEGQENLLLGVFQLHVLSLEVLREAVFMNLSNLLYLCENGRVHKFANSFCSLSFLLQDYSLRMKEVSVDKNLQITPRESEHDNDSKMSDGDASDLPHRDSHFNGSWKNYAICMSRSLCSFILSLEDVRSDHVEGSSSNIIPVSPAYGELSVKWFLRVLLVVFPCIEACSNQDESPSTHLRIFVYTLQRYIFHALRKVLSSSSHLLEVLRVEGLWKVFFSENFFFLGPTAEDLSIMNRTCDQASLGACDLRPISGYVSSQVNADDAVNLQTEVISLIEFAATLSGVTHNMPECSALLDALEQSAYNLEISFALAKSLFQILKLSQEKTVASFKEINAVSRVLKVAFVQVEESQKSVDADLILKEDSCSGSCITNTFSMPLLRHKNIEASIALFTAYVSSSNDAKRVVLHNTTAINYLFDLFWDRRLRNTMMGHILDLMKIASASMDDQIASLRLCSKYLETFNQVKEKEKDFADVSIDLLAGMRDLLLIDQPHYQELFRRGGCFLHVVSLLNGSVDVVNGDKLVMDVLQTLTSLLANNDVSKAEFKNLVGHGYRTLKSLLLDCCHGKPSEVLLNALIDMLVDGKFSGQMIPSIKNEDAIILYLSILQKSSDSLRQDGLNGFLQLLRHSISNRASCSSAGTLNFLLDWFSQEVNDNVILRMMPLIQVIGGHSISGRDIRKIFALLRSEKVAHRQQYCSLLMNSLLSMLNEKGPTAFFDLIRNDSGIILKTPMHWPVNKGFTFSCWLRVENFPTRGTMGLFAFLTENSRGCFSLLAEDKLFYKSINQKRHDVSLHVNLVRNKWHYLCITHSIGRAFSGASLLRCYIDGDLVSSERCRYPKVNDPLTNCAIGAKVRLPSSEEGNPFYSNEDVSPFLGQIGPVYLFSDSIPQEQVLAIYSLGPSYMYSFLDNEIPQSSDSCLSSGIFNAKDGLAAKMIFGLNAQASMKKALYNISPLVEHVLDKNSFEATLMDGTQLCSRRLLQQIIYCVGGISVFFPLFTQSHWYGYEEQTFGHTLPVTKEHLTAEVIELIASVLDENFLNQQQMHLVSGFSMMGFLLQSLPPQQLNMETLSALKHLFNVVVNCSWSELLVKDMISAIFLNPLVWVYTVYEVQRELYMFLIQQLDNNPRLLKCLCRLPRVFDIIHQCYCNSAKCVYSVGGKYLLHPIAEDVIGKRPCSDEIRKIRLLLLSLGEMSLRKNVEESDLKALVAFLEITQDMACVEDVLHMVIRGISQKPVLASFVEQINIIGGCHVFINLLQREYEPVRLLSLQLIGTLLVVIPSEKKGTKFFNIAVGRSKSLSEISRKNNLRMQSVLSAISDRIFRFPLTENLCTTLFDLLLGGASHKQVLRKQTPTEMQCVRGNVLQFSLPQILVLIFKCLSESKSTSQRIRIIGDLLDLVDSNPINIEALMEHGWIAWLATSMELDSVKNYRLESAFICDRQINEQHCVKQLFSVVLSHYIHYVKGGWQQLGETTTFLLMHFEQAGVSYHYLLRDIYEDIIRRLVDISVEENILASQPCRDNTLYLLRLLDELLLSEIDHKLPFPATCTEFSPDVLELEGFKDLSSALYDALQGEIDEKMSRNSPASNHSMKNEDFINDEDWWNLYDLSWILISELNGKGPRKMLLKSTSSTGPSLGQRARELVESLNIPAAEMAAVVSGGIGSALGGKSSRTVDKAMLLRGEKCPRVVVRLVVLYLCRAPLQRASRCVQQVIPLLPCLMMADDDLAKNQIQLFIWSLLAVRSEYGMLDGGTRFHVISHLIRETVSLGKSILAASAAGRDDSPDANAFPRELGAVHNLIQKDRVLAAASDESKCIKTFKTDRLKQLQELRARLDENLSMGSGLRKAFEDELQSCLSSIVASDESRRAAFQLPYNQELQSIAEKWMHIFRSLFDERGPWSAHPFPNHIRTHWKLDKTEDSWRRRLKLRRNYHFDENLCQPSSSTLGKEVAVSASESKSGSGLPIPEHMKRFLLKGIHKIINEGTVRPGDSDPESSSKAMYLREISDFQSPELVKGGGDQKGYVMKDSSLSVEANAGEILMSVPCVLITPKRKLAGRLAVMRTVVHFFGDFLIEGTAGSSVFHIFNSLNNSDSEKIEQSSATQNQKFVELPVNLNLNFERQNAQTAVGKHPKDVKCHRRWDVSKIKAVHWGRYLLQYTAIEIFFTNSIAPIFINFASNKIAKDVGSLIVTLRNELLLHKGSIRDRIGAISFVDRRVAQDIAEAARESWRRREMTNFEYLMILNTLAGRSYNDLTQYPVFPWVLADYSSATLDFNKSSTFRDLSKPVGALDLKRFEVFEDRYRNFSDSDIPSFYYGSHYSSTGIVLYYLVRLEPFTTLHRNLQGGKFDHADRLFQSIEGTYRNCLSNTSDVKELIPEFFYMPEFLVNSNSYHFGVKQDGEAIDNVCLPPWAKGSPEEFISRNREALESEYVSSNLHQWIDLVFGYKQRGKPAVEAANIFYYLTYEGAVDLESIEDDLQRSAVEDQIANFGQTPIQIFRKKHPRRGPPIPIAHPLQFAPTSVCLTSIISNKDQTSSPLLYVNILESSVVLVHQGLVMSVKMWLTTQLQSGGNFTFSGAQDPFSGIGYDILSPRKIGSPLADGIELGSQCFATLQTPSENFLISCGNWDNSFQIISLVDGRVVQSIRRHKDVVGTVAVSSDGSILATGSYETTVMVWEVCRPRAYEKRVRSNQSDIPRKEYVISETPFHVLCGHDDIVTCLHVSIELDIVVSGSKDGTCVFHTLREGRYVRSLRHPSGSTLSKLAVSHHGRVVLYSDDDLNLHLYSINGKHIATSESNGRLNCLELSACGEFLVCAGDQGQIVVRSMNSLDLVRKYTGIGKVITSLTVTAEECILAGTKDGKLLIYSIENPQVRKASVSNAKSKSTGAGSD